MGQIFLNGQTSWEPQMIMLIMIMNIIKDQGRVREREPRSPHTPLPYTDPSRQRSRDTKTTPRRAMWPCPPPNPPFIDCALPPTWVAGHKGYGTCHSEWISEKIRNPKREIVLRTPHPSGGSPVSKQYQNLNFKWPKWVPLSDFVFRSFDIWICFVLRYSRFGFFPSGTV